MEKGVHDGKQQWSYWLTNQSLSALGCKILPDLTLQSITQFACASLMFDMFYFCWMGTKKSKQHFTMIIDKYFTTNINIHYMIKNLECDYILKIRNSHIIMLFISTYNKASVSLTLEDTSRYLQGRYIESSYYPTQIWTYKKMLFHSKTKDHEFVQFSAVVRAVWDILDTQIGGEGQESLGQKKKKRMKGNANETSRASEQTECMSMNEHERTVVSTDKPLKRLCECVLLSLRLLKEHRQLWSDPPFSWGRFNTPAFSATCSLEYLSKT